MADIYSAIFLMTLIGGLLFGLSLMLYRILPGRWRKIIAAAVIGVILLHVFFLSGSTRWTRLLPVSAVIIYSNLLIPLSSILSGFVWGNRTLSILRRSTAVGLLAFLAYLPTVSQVYPVNVPYQDIWKDDVCIQSSYTSCVPAAAATFLKYYDIDSSEAEMAKLSLTRYDGTSMLGLYRGMKIKTHDAGYRVIVGKATVEQLKAMLMPVIVIITLDEETSRQKPQYAENDGWLVGISHSVVLFEVTFDDKILVGDPSVGREAWSIEALDDLWDGEYLRLE